MVNVKLPEIKLLVVIYFRKLLMYVTGTNVSYSTKGSDAYITSYTISADWLIQLLLPTLESSADIVFIICHIIYKMK